MASTRGVVLSLARTSETILRRISTRLAGHRAVRLIGVRIVGPGLTAVERFLDARADAFSSKGWV